MKKPNFTICCIARNEEKTLPRLIDSLKEFQERGGEIVILDTGSTDKTVHMAEIFGCEVQKVGEKFLTVLSEMAANEINEKLIAPGDEPIVKAGEKIFDFAAARNYAAIFSSNDMILMPDCDETFTKLDIDAIEHAIKCGAEQLEYNFVFAHNTDGSPSVTFAHSKFYDRRKLSWKGRIHEVLVGEAKKVVLDDSAIKLEHFQNKETDRSGYLRGLALSCLLGNGSAESPDRAKHYFARELMYHGRYVSAIRQFEEHIEMGGWSVERSESMRFIGDCHEFLGNSDEAFKWYIKAFDLEPNRREPLMSIAEHYYNKKMAAHAIPFALAATEIKGGKFYMNFRPYYENLPHEILYWAYWHTGDKEKSAEHFKKALAFSPNSKKYLKDQEFYSS